MLPLISKGPNEGANLRALSMLKGSCDMEYEFAALNRTLKLIRFVHVGFEQHQSFIRFRKALQQAHFGHVI